MSHGYWLAKWTNASSLPTRQSPVVLSCGEAKGTSLEWMEPPTSKTSTSTATRRLKTTTTMMQYHTNQEEAGPPYLKNSPVQENKSRCSGAKLCKPEKEGQKDCEKLEK